MNGDIADGVNRNGVVDVVADAARQHEDGALAGGRGRRRQVELLRQRRSAAFDQLDGQIGHAVGETAQLIERRNIAHAEVQAQVSENSQRGCAR